MNKFIMIVLSIVMLFSLAIGVGCDCDGGESTGGGNNLTPIEKTATVSLDKSSEKLIVGDYLTVVAYTNKVLDEDVTFESENESVATVSSRGQIEAVSAGTTNIVAKYGDATAKCSITVEWDNSYPVLIDIDGLEPSYVVFKNSSYEFRPAIKYRGRIYEDAEFTFVSTNEDVATFEGNVLKANDVLGVANCYVEASWRGFDVSTAPLLRGDFSVKIKNEAYISLKDTSEDFIELYTRTEFEGETYVNSGTIIPEFFAEGEKIDGVEFTTVILDDSLASYDGTTVTAKKFGETKIEISCEYEGEKYVKSIDIEIERPIADYEKEILKFSSDIGTFKDANLQSKTIVEEIYGSNDVTIIEAFQEYTRLTIDNNKILGVSGAKDDVYHTVITIGTDTEIYNVGLEVYGLYITEMADFNYFATQPSYNNYYYLANDIDATGFEFETNSNESGTGLTGIFEGNGYVISNITTKSKGLFGIVNGGTVQNVAFTNAILTGYYPCLIAHVERSSAKIKNVYVEVDSVAVRGACLFQQTLSASATHENVVVVYGISQDGVRSVMSQSGNSANISTFAPNRATVYKDTTLKNCFSISYAPVGCSSPNGNDFSWTSHMMAENQVVLGDVDENGDIPLTGVTDWDKELLAKTTPTDVLKTRASATATPEVSTGTDVLKGIKAYGTFEDLANDKANNQAILASFDNNYWTIVDGIPYWNRLYVEDLKIVLRTNDNEIFDGVTLTDNQTELTISLEDGSQSYTSISVEVPDCFELNGRTIKLKEMPVKPRYEEIVISGFINNVEVEKVLTMFVTPLGTDVEESIAYSLDDKELDFELLNSVLDLEGEDAISKDNIDFYYIGGDTQEHTGDLILPVKVAYDRQSVETVELTIIVNGKLYSLKTVVPYTKIINEAEDLKYFTLTKANALNKVDGYFIVTKDIDASELVFDDHQLLSNAVYPGSTDVGFVGVFDGQGHVISNITTKSNGIFGNVMSAIIKNVAFTNVKTTGYYPALFAHNSNRGKDENGSFTNIETELIDVYVQVDSIAKNSGLLFNNQVSPTSRFKNVVVEFLSFDDNENSTEMGWIKNGNKFSTFGPIVFDFFNETANYKSIYTNCYSISKAPFDVNSDSAKVKHYHFGENQVEYTQDPETGKVLTAVAKDPFVTQVLGYQGLQLTPANVALGLKAYDTYADMVADKANNTEWLETFNSDVWTVVNGVPYWKALYKESVELIVKDGEEVVTDYVLGNLDSKLSITLKDKGSVIEGATITASSDEIVVEGNVIRLKNKPLSTASYEVTVSATVNGITITKTITVSVIPTGIIVNAPINYSADDKALDFDAINTELGLEGDSALSQDDIVSYTLGSDTEVKTGELIVPVLFKDGSYGNDKIVEPQTVRFVIGEDSYEIRNVYAYTKVIDEAEDFNYFALTADVSALGIEGYFVLANDIDMTGFVQNTHAFVTEQTYPGGSDIGFHGVFDGKGHVVSNLDAQSNGIFGNATAPVIKNVAFTNVSIGGNYPTLFVHNIKRDGWIDGKGYTKEALFENVYIEVTEVRVTSGRANVLVNNSFYVGCKVRNVVVEMSLDETTLALVNSDTLKLGSMGGNASVMNATLMFENTYSISQAPLYSVGATPYFGENQVEITERNKNGIYIDAIGQVLDDNVKAVLTAKGLTVDKKYFAPRVKAYANRDAMKLDAEVNATSLATFNSNYWTIVDGVPVWNF